MRRSLVLYAMLVLFATALHAETYIKSVTVYYRYNGLDEVDSGHLPGTSITINYDAGTPVNVRIFKTDNAPDTVKYWYADYDNSKYEEKIWSDFYYQFNNVTGPNDGQVWAGIETSEGRVEIFTHPVYSGNVPDLTVSNISVDGSATPETYEVGQTVDLRSIVWNRGTAAAGASHLGYYIGTSSTSTSSRFGNSDAVDALSPGTGSNQSESYTFKPIDVGTRYFVLKADWQYEVDEESYESNNLGPFGPFQVLTPTNSPPTLTLTSPTDPIIVRQGETVTISWNYTAHDNNARVSLAYDVDCDDGGQNWIAAAIPEDPANITDSYSWNTTGVPPGTYRVWGFISDSVNDPVYSCAPGTVTINSPSLSFSPTSIDLGLVPIGGCITKEITITNNEVYPIIISSMTLDPYSNWDWHCSWWNYQLAPQSSVSLPIEIIVPWCDDNPSTKIIVGSDAGAYDAATITAQFRFPELSLWYYLMLVPENIESCSIFPGHSGSLEWGLVNNESIPIHILGQNLLDLSWMFNAQDAWVTILNPNGNTIKSFLIEPNELSDGISEFEIMVDENFTENNIKLDAGLVFGGEQGCGDPHVWSSPIMSIPEAIVIPVGDNYAQQCSPDEQYFAMDEKTVAYYSFCAPGDAVADNSIYENHLWRGDCCEVIIDEDGYHESCVNLSLLGNLFNSAPTIPDMTEITIELFIKAIPGAINPCEDDPCDFVYFGFHSNNALDDDIGLAVADTVINFWMQRSDGGYIENVVTTEAHRFDAQWHHIVFQLSQNDLLIADNGNIIHEQRILSSVPYSFGSAGMQLDAEHLNWSIFVDELRISNVARYNFGEQKPPVVLIHGIRSDNEAFGNLKSILESKGRIVRYFPYSSRDSHPDDYDVPIQVLSDSLHIFLDQLNDTIPILSTGVDIIGHSMGGLIARFYMANPNSFDTHYKVDKLITLGTPNYGSGVGTSLLDLGFGRRVQGDQMDYGSQFLWDLYFDWSNVPSETKVLSIAGAGLGYLFNTDLLVLLSSAGLANLNYPVWYVPKIHFGSIANIIDEQHESFVGIDAFLAGTLSQSMLDANAEIQTDTDGMITIGLFDPEGNSVGVGMILGIIPSVWWDPGNYAQGRYVNDQSKKYWAWGIDPGTYTFTVYPVDGYEHETIPNVRINPRECTMLKVTVAPIGNKAFEAVGGGDAPPITLGSTGIELDFSSGPGGDVSVYRADKNPPLTQNTDVPLPHYWEIAFTPSILDSSFATEITFHYDDVDLPIGLSESELGIAYLDSTWHMLTGSVVNTLDNTVSAPVNHFSIFAVGKFCEQVATLLQGYSAGLEGPSIRIKWTLSSIDDNAKFFVYRAMNSGGVFDPIIETTISRSDLSFEFIDKKIEPGTAYRYRIEVQLTTGKKILFETDQISTPQLPVTLYQNSPNPFNPSTTIRYYLPDRCSVELDIYDTSGRRIAGLVAGEQEKGSHSVDWNGKDAQGNSVASGIYFYRLTTGKETVSKKMVLLR